MDLNKLCYLVILAVIFLFPLRLVSSPDDTEPYFIARGFQENNGVVNFFSHYSKDEIEALTDHPNIKIATFAAWLSCRRECFETQSTPDDIASTEKQRDDFLNTLQLKLDVIIPDWWAEQILNLKLFDDPNYLSIPLVVEYPKDASSTNGFHHANGIVIHKATKNELSVVKSGKAFSVATDGASWAFGDGFFEKTPAWFDLSDEVRNRRAFAFSDQHLDRFYVFCVDKRGQKLWKSEVSCFIQKSIGYGMLFSTNRIEISSNDKIFAVFCVNKFGISVDAFNVETGEPLLRFTTFID